MASGLIAIPIIDKKTSESIDYGMGEIGEFNVVMDLRTGYVNGTKFIRNFNTRNDTCLRFDNWQRDNAANIEHVKNHVIESLPHELVNDDIMYVVNGNNVTVPEGFDNSLNLIVSEKETLTLDEINARQYFNTTSGNLRNFTAGTYIHVFLCMGIIEWMDKSKYALHVRIISNFYNKHTFMKAVVNDKLAEEDIAGGAHDLKEEEHQLMAELNNSTLDIFKNLCEEYERQYKEAVAEKKELEKLHAKLKSRYEELANESGLLVAYNSNARTVNAKLYKRLTDQIKADPKYQGLAKEITGRIQREIDDIDIKVTCIKAAHSSMLLETKIHTEMNKRFRKDTAKLIKSNEKPSAELAKLDEKIAAYTKLIEEKKKKSNHQFKKIYGAKCNAGCIHCKQENGL